MSSVLSRLAAVSAEAAAAADAARAPGPSAEFAEADGGEQRAAAEADWADTAPVWEPASRISGSSSRRVSAVEPAPRRSSVTAPPAKPPSGRSRDSNAAADADAAPTSTRAFESALASEAANALLRQLRESGREEKAASDHGAVALHALVSALQASEARAAALTAELHNVRAAHDVAVATSKTATPDSQVSLALLSRLSAAESALRSKESALEAARVAAAAHASDVANMEMHATSVRDQLQRLHAQLNDARTAAELATSQADMWRRQAEAAVHEAEQVRKTNAGLSRDCDRLRGELVTARSTAEMLTSAAASSDERIAALRADARAARDRASGAAQAAKEAVRLARDDAAALAAEKEALARQLTAAHGQLRRAAATLRSAATREDELRRSAAEWRSRAEDTARQLHAATAELHATRSAAQDMLDAAVGRGNEVGALPSILSTPSKAAAHHRFERPSQSDSHAVTALVAAAAAAAEKPAGVVVPETSPGSRSMSPQSSALSRVAAAVAVLEQRRSSGVEGGAVAAAEHASTPQQAAAAPGHVEAAGPSSDSPELGQLVQDAAHAIAHQQVEIDGLEALAARMMASRDAAIQQLSARLSAAGVQQHNKSSSSDS